MADRPPVPELEFRLGYLKSFLAVARHGSFEAAAADMKCDPSTVRRQMDRLGNAFLKLLVVTEPRVKLFKDGKDFVPIASHWVRLLSGAVSDASAGNEEDSSDAWSNLRLSDLVTFLEVAEEKVYKRSKNAEQARRSVHRIEKAIGADLFEGRSTVALTEQGEKFMPVAQRIVDASKNFRCKDPKRAIYTAMVEVDPMADALERFSKFSDRQYDNAVLARKILDKSPKPTKKEAIQRDRYDKLIETHERLMEIEPSLRRKAPAPDIDMDAFFAERAKVATAPSSDSQDAPAEQAGQPQVPEGGR